MQCANSTDVNSQPISRETPDVVIVPYKTGRTIGDELEILYYCFTLPQAFEIVNGTGVNPLNPNHTFSDQTKMNIRMRMDQYNRQKNIQVQPEEKKDTPPLENLFPYGKQCFGDTARSVLTGEELGTHQKDHIVTIIDTLTDSREKRVYCFDYVELARAFRQASRLYEWDVPYNERNNNPVFLLPITSSHGISNIYIDKQTHDAIINDKYDTILFTGKRHIRIGSTIGISRLHGASSDVFTGIPVSRSVLGDSANGDITKINPDYTLNEDSFVDDSPEPRPQPELLNPSNQDILSLLDMEQDIIRDIINNLPVRSPENEQIVRELWNNLYMVFDESRIDNIVERVHLNYPNVELSFIRQLADTVWTNLQSLRSYERLTNHQPVNIADAFTYTVPSYLQDPEAFGRTLQDAFNYVPPN